MCKHFVKTFATPRRKFHRNIYIYTYSWQVSNPKWVDASVCINSYAKHSISLSRKLRNRLHIWQKDCKALHIGWYWKWAKARIYSSKLSHILHRYSHSSTSNKKKGFGHNHQIIEISFVFFVLLFNFLLFEVGIKEPTNGEYIFFNVIRNVMLLDY